MLNTLLWRRSFRTVNENLLVEHLLKTEKDPKERLALLNQYLENFKGTVFRQAMFAEFEKSAHEMAERGEALNPGFRPEMTCTQDWCATISALSSP